MAITIEKLESIHESARSVKVIVHNKGEYALVTCYSSVVHFLSALHYPQIVNFKVKWHLIFVRGVHLLVTALYWPLWPCL